MSRMHRRRFLIAATAGASIAFTVGCGDASREQSAVHDMGILLESGYDAPSAPPAPAAAPTPPEVAKVGDVERAAVQIGGAPQFTASSAARAMLVRTGSARLEVPSLDRGVQGLRELALRHGAEVGDMAVGSGQHQVTTATLELRVPSDRFDALLVDLPGVGKVEWLDLKAQDVGEEYVDITARVANAKRLEARLLALVSAQSARLADVLAVERELARVREEIERLEGRMRFLAERASTGRMSITLHEPSPAFATRPGETPIRDAFKEAWRNLVGLVAFLIAASGVVIPVGLAVAGAWVLARRIQTRRRLA